MNNGKTLPKQNYYRYRNEENQTEEHQMDPILQKKAN